MKTFTDQYSGAGGGEIVTIPNRKFIGCKDCKKLLGVIFWDIDTDGITNWDDEPNIDKIQCMECFNNE